MIQVLNFMALNSPTSILLPGLMQCNTNVSRKNKIILVAYSYFNQKKKLTKLD